MNEMEHHRNPAQSSPNLYTFILGFASYPLGVGDIAISGCYVLDYFSLMNFLLFVRGLMLSIPLFEGMPAF